MFIYHVTCESMFFIVYASKFGINYLKHFLPQLWKETDIHSSYGIRTHSPRKPAPMELAKISVYLIIIKQQQLWDI